VSDHVDHSDDEYQSLVQFLYRTPVGLIEFSRDGAVMLMNPKAAQLLMPVSSNGGLTNLFDILADDLPALRSELTKRPHPRVESLRFTPCKGAGGRPGKVLSLSIFGHGSETLTAVLHDATTDERRQQRRVEAARTIDSTTGLPNRLGAVAHLRLMLDPAQGAAEPATLIYLGLDRFQQINDTAGHLAGDEVLAQIADRLLGAAAARAPDFAETVPGGVLPEVIADALVARVGGDEYAVVLRGVGASQAQAAALRLLHDLGDPIVVGDKAFSCTASVGVMSFEAGTPEAILYRARLAMQAAKEAGGHQLVMFEGAMEQRAQQRSAMELELRHAIERDQLFVVYQPVIGLDDNSLQGVEALVRWRHPDLGLVSPGDFIGIAEDSGIIDAIGHYVLKTACAQFVRWQQRYGDRAPRLLAVNLSRAQLPRESLAQEVADVLRLTGMHARHLQLEITESMAAQDAQVQRRLHELKRLGLSLALDDFGTGFSSLSSLHELPVDLLKIDRSFVSQLETSPHHRVLVEATLRVAKSLGLGTVAEGVETQGQAGLLTQMRCEKAQGYLISPPLTVAQFDDWMALNA
jgi:diguanylate cyclase (GGDEF)-like protein